MEPQDHRRHGSRTPRVPSICALLLVFPLILVSCPAENVSPVPDSYYRLVEAGVSSRVMGIRAPGESLESARHRVEALLSEVKAQWSSVAPLDTAAELLAYYRAQQLIPIAEAIAQTLTANQVQEPADMHHSQLQANAIKQGLVSAYQQVKGEPLR